MIEIELKYAVADQKLAEKILQDEYWRELSGGADWQRIPMKAVYYDTEDHLLRERRVAFRIRQEGEDTTASIKFAGQESGGLHRREEINIPLNGGATDGDRRSICKTESGGDDPEAEGENLARMFGEPEIKAFAAYDSFRKTGIDPERIRLHAFMQTDFMRHCMEIHWQGCRCEVALDVGKISAGGREIKLCELEIELIDGKQESMSALGEAVQNRYGIEPESQTKFSRGLKLYGR